MAVSHINFPVRKSVHNIRQSSMLCLDNYPANLSGANRSSTPKKKKNQLPSGSYRVQVYSHTDSDGRKHYKSFTAPSKKLAQAAANDWLAKRDAGIQTPDDLTVYEAITRYINVKKGVLSPSTLKEHAGMQKRYFTGTLDSLKLARMRSQDVQLWISDLAGKLSPKTVCNAYGLLEPALAMFAPDLRLRVTLPQRQKPELYCPNDDDIRALLHHIHGKELEIAVLLAAFGPLRRSEICALTDRDFTGNKVKITKSMVQDADGSWVIKNHPKTYGSYREIELPDFVTQRLYRNVIDLEKEKQTKKINDHFRSLKSV